MTRIVRSAVALIVLVAVALGSVLLVRMANGDYSGAYHLTGMFPRAGEGLQPGSEVVFRGVQVGRVSTISLVDSRAQVSVLIDPTFRVPTSATATIRPVNLFGAEEMSLTTPGGNADNGPYLSPGSSFAHAVMSSEIGDLFNAATPLLNQVNTVNLSNVISELAQASNGEGPRIASSIEEGSKLAGFLDSTLQAQLNALASFARFSAVLAPDASAINGISQQENIALPEFNRNVADYQRLLESLTPFANQLATILSDYHPDIATILASGDNVARVLTAQQANIGQVIQGAYLYADKLGHASSTDVLPDGSTFGYFNTFILFADVNQLVCSLIAPAGTGMSFLEPLQQALAGAGSAFNCSSQLAAFNAAQSSPTAPTTSTAPPAPAVSAPNPTSSSAAQGLANQAYGILGKPSSPASASGSIGGYINSLLGGGS
ncbi:MAG TPA: MlaD family protein [Acidimicrobiales bacterium]|nr:MlaD family protein [Acidimicrobiales bacterium]